MAKGIMYVDNIRVEFDDEPTIMDVCRKAGVDVHPWTANDPQVMRELVEAGVAAIITNYPNLALQAAGR